jgi:hypothetical protein
MKHILITTIAAVVLVGCGEAKDKSTLYDAKLVGPVLELKSLPIHKAAESGDIEAVKQYLSYETDVNAKDVDGWTSLHHAAYFGNKEIVELLLSRKANLNLKNVDGRTPLHLATFLERFEIVELLIANGANINLIDEAGASPLGIAKKETKRDWQDYFVFTALVVFGPLLAFLLYKFSYLKWQTHRLMVSTETSQISNLHSGPVEVFGKAEASGNTLLSPWGNEKCIYYEFHVEIVVSDGESSKWETYVKDKKFVPFLINDNTGRVIVNPNTIEFDLHKDHVFKSSLFKEAPSELQQLLKTRYGKKTKGKIFNKTMRFTESTIHPYEKVYVFGNASKQEDGWVLNDGEMPLIVSDKGEAAVEKRLWNDKYVYLVLFFIFTAITFFGFNWSFKYNHLIINILLIPYIVSLIYYAIISFSKNTKSRQVKSSTLSGNKLKLGSLKRKLIHRKDERAKELKAEGK